MATLSVYEAAGGEAAFLALARAHHERCLADPVLNHPFSHGTHPDHVARLGAYWGEVFGGPPSYSDTVGGSGHTPMLAIHANQGAEEELGERFLACFVQAIDDAGLPADPALGVPRWSWSGPAPTLRPSTLDDAGAVADIWHQGWRDGHLGHVPDALLAVRTEASFHQRAAQRVADTTVAVVHGVVAGFVMVVDDEVEQVYVAAGHRGSGVAATVLGAAERRVSANGYDRAWLAVVAGNVRARAFYARQGWVDAGAFDYTAAGGVTVPSHRYEKGLA